MSESHIAHAIATFSELGIATGLVWLSDVVKFRSNLEAELIVAEESLRVTTADYHTKANEFYPALRLVIRLWMNSRKMAYTMLIAFLLGLLRWSPYACVSLGVYALFGISFYPGALNITPSFFIYGREMLDKIYFTMAFLSFMSAFIPIIPMATKAVINRYVLRDIEIV